MNMDITVNGKTYEMYITFRELINDGCTSVSMDDAEQAEVFDAIREMIDMNRRTQTMDIATIIGDFLDLVELGVAPDEALIRARVKMRRADMDAARKDAAYILLDRIEMLLSKGVNKA